VVLPCAVDVQSFRPVPESRVQLRRELDLRGVVLVYAGKAGGWYLTDAMLEFVAAAADALGEVSLLVLTTEATEPFTRAAAGRGFRHAVRRASRDEMPRYLSSADAGLSFVLPSPSKTACSPVKNGEYLACGRPVVTTAAIGDYSDLVARRRVGVVVESLDRGGYETAARTLGHLLADPLLGERCRETARVEVGLYEVVVPRYEDFYRKLLGDPPMRGLGSSTSSAASPGSPRERDSIGHP
jgi:glycosyltransferase involved in cell wall biosynthesis